MPFDVPGPIDLGEMRTLESRLTWPDHRDLRNPKTTHQSHTGQQPGERGGTQLESLRPLIKDTLVRVFVTPHDLMCSFFSAASDQVSFAPWPLPIAWPWQLYS